MKPQSSNAFDDHDTLRWWRNWLAAHGRAGVEDVIRAIEANHAVPSAREMAGVLELLGDESPGGGPAILADFVARLAEARGASTVLDAYARSPVAVTMIAERLPQVSTAALTPNESIARLGRMAAPEVDWRLGMPLGTLIRANERFDFIAGTPPLGVRGERYPMREELGDYANSLMVDAAERLSEGGALVFLVSDGFFFRTDARKTQRELAERGLRLEAAISIERGLRPLSDIATSLVVFTRGEELDRTFVGRLDSTTDPGPLVANMLARRSGSYLQLGVLYPTDRYRGWNALSNEAKLLSGLASAKGHTPVTLDDIALTYVRAQDEAETANCVYIPEFPSAPVTFNPPEKLKGYTRVDLSPGRANARWVAEWLNEPLGRTARRAIASAGAIERVGSQDLHRLVVALPTVEEQATAIRIAQELELIAREVTGARAGLWSGHLPVDGGQRFLERVQGAFADEAVPDQAAPTVASWIEELPFPLAGIGRRYLTVAPTREKVDHLQHFFEAYAIFIATILLSAAHRDIQTYDATTAKIRRASDGSSVLDVADFHTWINLGRTVAKRIRSSLNGDSGEIRRTLFGNLSETFVEGLLAGDFWGALDAARRVRNDRGHGGIEGDDWLEGNLDSLEAALNELRLASHHMFIGTDLVLPGLGEQMDANQFLFHRAKRLKGSHPQFVERPLSSSVSMLARRLHLTPSAGIAERPLELLSLVQLIPIPGTADHAVYFYSRVATASKFRFVSYQYEARPEENLEDPQVATLLADIAPR